MSSPFQTLEEFKQATDGPTEGAIYTFANNPGVIGVALVVSVLPLLWFIYASYTIKAETETRDPVNLSLLIVAGVASLFGSLAAGDRAAVQETHLQRDGKATVSTTHRRPSPIALLGFTGGALPLFRRPRKHSQRRKLRHITPLVSSLKTH